MTPESRESQWVRTECEYAAQKGKQAFPLLLAGEVFFRYVSVQYVDVRDGSLPPDSFLDELAEFALRKRVAGHNVTPPEVSEADDAAILTVRISSAAVHQQLSRPRSRKRTPYVIGAVLIAALILVAVLMLLASQSASGNLDFEDRLTEDTPLRSYAFTGEAGDLITINMVSEDFDTHLSLLDADGNEITADDDSGGNHNSRIGPFTLSVSGNYTIIAQSFAYFNSGERAIGAYSLRLDRLQPGVIEPDGTEEATSCQFDWFFGNELALEGDCPVSDAIIVDGVVQRFENGLILAMRIPTGDGQFAFLTDEGIFYGRVGEWDVSDSAVGSCMRVSAYGVTNTMPSDGSADEVLGCPVEEVQLGTIDFQESDSTSEYVVYVGTSDGEVYRLVASSSTAEEGEWQPIP